jgi:endonuclease III
MTMMTKRERYTHIISYFQQNVPVAETELRFSDSFSLLVSVIISAQSTVKEVNMIALFT